MDYTECTRSEDYLNDQHLSRLKNYQYRSVDHSPTTRYILRHWWEYVAGWMPPWLAPNTITLIGLMFIVLNVMTVIIYIPDLKTDAPSWVYFSFALGLFIYQTMDNVDGKQARKTGTSSPLGELFDHGIDSLNCVLGGLVQCAAVGTGHSLYAVFILIVACWPMYLSTWEEYHTGILYLGFVNGPTEGLLIAMAVLLSTGFGGVQMWSKPAEDLVYLPRLILTYCDKFGHQLKLLDLFVSFVLFALVFGHAPSCFYNTYVAIRNNQSQPRSKQDSRISSFSQALLRLFPLLIFTFCSASWLASSNSHILKSEKIIEFGLMLCLIFGRIATRIILSHLTKSTFPFWSGMLIPIIGGSIAINLPMIGLPAFLSPWGELVYLRLMFFFTIVGYFGSSLRTIDRFCQVLRINCLTIRSKSAA
ncbi:hypothetical protein PTTG_00724 [Puccinia triticina 1-1 BBBD Race 1]|uniref:Uncharacterized protein n=3 Tax=Puccinia triticina TaxID=208348 RepID=A0A180GC25_PUCT1|nr:uncharacterized protein PtA15_3A45 [Puccinia triticina]OAV90235.1 hypothetical protein PTTG_00724 [Puccinia triticina 1-1 BBBD Race 1]WAQ82682.1 hypothetical protein PtA15_3A45 [Puccinia triticina]WAR53526.1 hypothetical protein PtB15_3B34 [Puccinia triticina]